MEASVPARAALAGNPSDGYGGAVVATLVPHFAATARLTASPCATPKLVSASIARCAREFGADPRTEVSIETTIPRSVGLAGSSAIVLAVINLLATATNVELDPERLSRIAHAVERDDLGIAGGWQDQVIQAHGVTGLMEFGDPFTFRALDIPTASPIPLFLAWNDADAESSGISHAGLQQRRNDQSVQAHMYELAGLARDAADCLLYTSDAADE